MIIHKDFLIGNIPKTGSHAISVMCKKAGLKFQCQYDLKGEIAYPTEANPHLTFEHQNTKNKDLILIIRRLPDYFFSIIWHSSIHYRFNKLEKKERILEGGNYTKDKKKLKQTFLYSSNILSYSIFPDYTLKIYTKEFLDRIIWLRMENLTEDFAKYLKIPVSKIETSHYHSYTNKQMIRNFWTDEQIKTLYKFNPFWRKTEAIVYQ